MVDINPLIHVISHIKMGLKSNRSMRTILRDYFSEEKSNSYSEILEEIILKVELGKESGLESFQLNEYRYALTTLILRGLKGDSIWDALIELEKEVLAAVTTELEEFNGALPVKLLLPMILIIFPALILLTVGPVIVELLHSLQSN